MEWSAYQKAVFEEVRTGAGHLMVDAVAGSGKTTTILEALSCVSPGQKVIFVAFNKSIADALKRRAPANVEVSTLHSLGLRAVSKALGRPRIDADKCKTIVDKVTGADEFRERREWSRSVAKAVSLCKGYLATSAEEIDRVVDAHGLVPPTTVEERPGFIRNVLEVLRLSQDDDASIDFDDMIFLPWAMELRPFQFDRVFVDETQDLNAAQIDLVLRVVREGGRVCAVGDPRQAIYQFRGAADDAFDRVRERLAAKTLPLSVTYRCCKSVVREAKELVPHLEAAEDAEEGSVSACGEDAMMREARPGDFVLSRINAPLLKICLAFLKEGRRATIQGRDIGARLAGIIRRSKARGVEEMLAYADGWASLEAARLEKRGRDGGGVLDTVECLHALAEGEKSLDAVERKIGELFSDGDDSSKITLSTTHKAKGLERDRVWLLRDTYCRKRKGQTSVAIEEQNLLYVAITRARKDLRMVRGSA
jgi:superfamily I DNA/RNA helicase